MTGLTRVFTLLENLQAGAAWLAHGHGTLFAISEKLADPSIDGSSTQDWLRRLLILELFGAFHGLARLWDRTEMVSLREMRRTLEEPPIRNQLVGFTRYFAGDEAAEMVLDNVDHVCRRIDEALETEEYRALRRLRDERLSHWRFDWPAGEGRPAYLQDYLQLSELTFDLLDDLHLAIPIRAPRTLLREAVSAADAVGSTVLGQISRESDLAAGALLQKYPGLRRTRVSNSNVRKDMLAIFRMGRPNKDAR